MSSKPVSVPFDTAPETDELPLLESGDHLDQPTFHRLYEQMPEDFRAELIGGIVFVPSPLKKPHGRMHTRVIRWLTGYEDATPGTETLDNTTAILGPVSEPQPDVCLIIAPEKKGQTREEDEYMVGAPELIVEIATTRRNIDLHRKREDYEREGVREYIVVVLRRPQVLWFVLRNGSYEEVKPGEDNILRSEVFPGLWLDPDALLSHNHQRVLEVLQLGLASPEHAAFVADLAVR